MNFGFLAFPFSPFEGSLGLSVSLGPEPSAAEVQLQRCADGGEPGHLGVGQRLSA